MTQMNKNIVNVTVSVVFIRSDKYNRNNFWKRKDNKLKSKFPVSEVNEISLIFKDLTSYILYAALYSPYLWACELKTFPN
jgi:hypothetical protein